METFLAGAAEILCPSAAAKASSVSESTEGSAVGSIDVPGCGGVAGSVAEATASLGENEPSCKQPVRGRMKAVK